MKRLMLVFRSYRFSLSMSKAALQLCITDGSRKTKDKAVFECSVPVGAFVNPVMWLVVMLHTA
jgi:hypothetical protein